MQIILCSNGYLIALSDPASAFSGTLGTARRCRSARSSSFPQQKAFLVLFGAVARWLSPSPTSKAFDRVLQRFVVLSCWHRSGFDSAREVVLAAWMLLCRDCICKCSVRKKFGQRVGTSWLHKLPYLTNVNSCMLQQIVRLRIGSLAELAFIRSLT